MQALLKSHPPLFISSEIYRAAGYPPGHPLHIGRIGPVTDICQALGWLTPDSYRESPMATPQQLAAFHDADFVAALASASETGQVPAEWRLRYHLGTMENPVFPGLYQRAATSVGGSILAAKQALEGRVAYHPAGGTHHGRRDRASGFCYFNDPVFAILTLLEGGAARVAYIDLDAHHGDGVEDAFSADDRVLCLSLHEVNRWPGTGQGHTPQARNYPVPKGWDDAALARLMRDKVLPELAAFAPDAVVITCGADGLKGDPLSSMALSNGGLWSAVLSVVSLASAAVVLGGGGYNPWTTVRCWSGLWAKLNGFAVPESLPAEVRHILASFTCDLVDDEDIDPAWLVSLADHPEDRE